MKHLLKLIIGLVRWFGRLLSDSRAASIRRVIGLISFLLMVKITFFALHDKKLQNTELLMYLAHRYFIIVMATIVTVTGTDLVALMYPPAPNPYDYSGDTTETTTSGETGGE